MAHGNKSWSSAPFSLSRDDQVEWRADTIIVMCTFVEDSTSIDGDYFSLSFLSSRGKRARWHADTHMVVCILCRRLSVYRLRLLKSPPSSTRGNRTRWHAETKSSTLFRRRPNVYPPRLLKSPSSSTRGKRARWHTETIIVIYTLSKTQRLSTETTLVSPFHQLEASEPVDMEWPTWSSAPFVEDTTSIDQDYFSLSFSSSKGKPALWHTETIIVICTFVKDSTSIN